MNLKEFKEVISKISNFYDDYLVQFYDHYDGAFCEIEDIKVLKHKDKRHGIEADCDTILLDDRK